MTALLLKIILGVFGMTALAVVGGFIAQGVDRKLVAMMQARIGPKLRQPYWDFLKLMQKENIVPEHAVAWVFNAAPVIAFAAAVSIMLYIPFAGFGPVLEGYGDLILVMYLLVMSALAMVIGGFSAASPYSAIGAQREMVTMIAYEAPLGAIVISFAWKLSQVGLDNPFSLKTIAENPVWNIVGPFGVIGFVLLLFAQIIVTPGELSKVPFDSPEAKSELADGLMVEYSGRNLAMFYLALGTKMIVMSALTIALFFPYTISGCLHVSSDLAAIIDIAFFVLKIFVVMFFSITLMRASMARFRITQVVEVYWKFGGTLTILGLLLLMLDSLIK
ncbi:NADH-quinone oxidoreductase subunit H [bacterium]|nr:NADH-quinone oxidoreductase subunit H [bacterium]